MDLKSPVIGVPLTVLAVLCLAAILYFLWEGVPCLIAIAKRLFFSVRLGRFCEKKGYKLHWHRPWYRTPFSVPARFDFTVCTPAKAYHVKFLSAPRRMREYAFVSPTELCIRRKIVTKVVGKTRRFAQLVDLPLAFASRSVPVSLEDRVPAGEEKVLLLYPVSRDVTSASAGNRSAYLGKGDLFWNRFRFFNRSGFFEELNEPGKYLRESEKAGGAFRYDDI